MACPPATFERLAERLLREANYRTSRVSFPDFFQCKRYHCGVGAGTIRDFRGAMSGRGVKGLLIATGTFTRDAEAEATRDGAPPVDLIDGQSLYELLRRYNLGLTTVGHD